MLIAIIGENCVGKSTLAEFIKGEIGGIIYSGKDYLRLEKSPTVAKEKFKNQLIDAVNGENVIYLITETEHLDLLPKGAKRIVLTADLDVIKERFKVRMRGVLPPPVEKMLENRHGIFDRTDCDILLKDGEYSKQDIIKLLK